MNQYRRSLIFLLVTVFLALSILIGCDNPAGPDNDDSPDPESGETILDIVAANTDFSTFLDIIDDLDERDSLEAPGPITAFVPTNAAFETMVSDLGLDNIDEVDGDLLEDVVLYHLVQSELTGTGVFSETFAQTESIGFHGNTLTMHVQTAPSLLINGGVDISSTGIDVSNGTVYSTDKVILPVQVVTLIESSTILSNFYDATDSASNGSITFREFLLLAEDITLFVPTNTAFSDIQDDYYASSSGDQFQLLAYHFIDGTVTASEWGSSPTIYNPQTAEETRILVFNTTDSHPEIIDDSDGTSSIILTDLFGSDGVVHLIDRVLRFE